MARAVAAGPSPLACERSLAEDIHCASIRYPSYVTKRLIEVDDDKLAQACALLGTSTLKATVDAALDELLALDRRRRASWPSTVSPTISWPTRAAGRRRGVRAVLPGGHIGLGP